MNGLPTHSDRWPTLAMMGACPPDSLSEAEKKEADELEAKMKDPNYLDEFSTFMVNMLQHIPGKKI